MGESLNGGNHFCDILFRLHVIYKHNTLQGVILPIIIINWNRASDTIECIESIKSCDLVDIVLDIHVWDNNSNQKDLEVLKNKAKSLSFHLHESNQNIGFTRANNALFSKVLDKQIQSSGYVMCLNNDTTLTRNFFQNLRSTLHLNKIDMISCKMLKYFNRTEIDNIGHHLLSSGEILPILAGKPDKTYKNLPYQLGACAGACIYSLDMLKDIGLFDENFNTGYEDAEYALRATMESRKISLIDSAIVYHKGGMSIKGIFNSEFAIREQMNVLYTIYKLYPPILLTLITPLILLRGIIIVIATIIMLRPEIAKVTLVAYWKFFTGTIKKAIKNRKSFSAGLRKEFLIIKIQSSAIILDIKRFYTILVKRSLSFIEKY